MAGDSRASSMFLAAGSGSAFQSRAAAVFGALPCASLPREIPDDLLGRGGASGSGSSEVAMDAGQSGVHSRDTYVAPIRQSPSPKGQKRRHDDGGGGQEEFERPQVGLSLPSGPSPRKRRSRGYRPPDHILHPERYTKYSLEEAQSAPFAGMSDEEKNRAGAMQFFAEVRKRRDADLADADGNDNEMDTGRVVFRKATERRTKPAAVSTSSNGDSGMFSDDRELSMEVSTPKTLAVPTAAGGNSMLSFDGDDSPVSRSSLTEPLDSDAAGPDDAVADIAASAAMPVSFAQRRKFRRGRARATSGSGDEDDDDDDASPMGHCSDN